MRDQIEGSQAVARAVAACRPGVICAYPITPQTHIVEALGRMVRSGHLADCAYINVESEFAALSVAIGAAAAGSRAYTATASQGLLFMAEAVYNAGGLGFPIVMTIGNRAVGAPINIWNDHSDSMALRDAGWIQLYAGDNQAATDLHPLAFALAEDLSVPVMVCMDGFSLTHAVEPVDIPEQSAVDAFLPALRPRQRLDPAAPISIGAMVGPDRFTEVRHLQDARMRRAPRAFERLCAFYSDCVGRETPAAILRRHRLDDAAVAVVAMGSVTGTLEQVVDADRAAGGRSGLLEIGMFRPFPAAEVAAALRHCRRIVVIERAITLGSDASALGADVRAALGSWNGTLQIVAAGLGGRDLSPSHLATVLDADWHQRGPILDLDLTILNAESKLPPQVREAR